MSTNTLECWLRVATRQLSAASAVRVRTEIQEHHESAREAAEVNGATAEEADRAAVAALGNPREANRQYRKILVTTSEARLLREINWEGRAICSRPWLRWLLLIPAVGAGAGVWFLAAGQTHLASVLLAGMAGLGLLFASPFLPIYSGVRGRVFRGVRWAWLVSILVLASWPDVFTQFWLLWPLIWVEWMLMSLRRKLPVAEWPKQLYL